MRSSYDAIVVGARCAGASTALLLARAGYRVLVVDRATFPSDTVSTHIIHPRGVAALARWGLRERLAATGCPPIDTYVFDFGSLTISGARQEGTRGDGHLHGDTPNPRDAGRSDPSARRHDVEYARGLSQRAGLPAAGLVGARPW